MVGLGLQVWPLRTAHDCHVSRLDCVGCECQSIGGGPVVARQTGRTHVEIGCEGAGLSLIRSVPISRRAGKNVCLSRAGLLAAGYLDYLPIGDCRAADGQTREGMAMALALAMVGGCSLACRRAYS